MNKSKWIVGINQTIATNNTGTVKFSNLTISNYILNYDWTFQSLEDENVLTKPTKISYLVLLSDQTTIIIAIIGLIVLAIGLIVLAVVAFLILKKRVR